MIKGRDACSAHTRSDAQVGIKFGLDCVYSYSIRTRVRAPPCLFRLPLNWLPTCSRIIAPVGRLCLAPRSTRAHTDDFVSTVAPLVLWLLVVFCEHLESFHNEIISAAFIVTQADFVYDASVSVETSAGMYYSYGRAEPILDMSTPSTVRIIPPDPSYPSSHRLTQTLSEVSTDHHSKRARSSVARVEMILDNDATCLEGGFAPAAGGVYNLWAGRTGRLRPGLAASEHHPKTFLCCLPVCSPAFSQAWSRWMRPSMSRSA